MNKPIKVINETGVCSICGAPYEHFGNNPYPVRDVDERCCDKCNWEVVVPIRMNRPVRYLGTYAELQRMQKREQL